jgi:putative acetyltransferase
MDIEIRQATLEDLPEIVTLFRETITAVNSKHYNDNQIEIWASGANDTDKWEDRIKNFYFIVGEYKNQIVGYAYLKNGNYLDGLFVHKDYQRVGIASKLLRIMESHAMFEGYEDIRSDVSITAIPFFESHYYEVIKKQKKVVKGMNFENYIVTKVL